MADTGTPPVIPAQFRQYDSYVEDPKYQTKLTIVWTSFFALYALSSSLFLLRQLRVRGWCSVLGLSVDSKYDVLQQREERRKEVGGLEKTWRSVRSVLYWSVPGLGLDLGQLILLAAYFTTVITTMALNAPLMSNSNRPGFIAISLLPPLYAPLPLSLNYLHRWTGRLMLLGAILHGGLWIRNHLQYGLPILGQQKETSGVASLAVLGLIGITSVRLVRRRAWEGFWILHILLTTAFFITICYHTIYAEPWIYPPLAFFGFSIVMRLLRLRFTDAVLVAVDKQMTLIHTPHIPLSPGAHLNLTLFHPSTHIFESHPVSIITAAPHISCIPEAEQGGMVLGVRVIGGWSKSVNLWAREGSLVNSSFGDEKKEGQLGEEGVPAHVLLSPSPNSGAKIDLGQYESVLLLAGGSGATWVISLLDDIVGRIVRRGREGGEKTRRVGVVWCVRSFGSIAWFAPLLSHIATRALSCPTLSLHITIHVTCLCSPEAVPPIPNCDVVALPRPDVYKLLVDLSTPPSSFPNSPSDSDSSKNNPTPKDKETQEDTASISTQEELQNITTLKDKLPWVGYGGGLAIAACGPESLVREAKNAGARLGMSECGYRMGGVDVCVEGYEI